MPDEPQDPPNPQEPKEPRKPDESQKPKAPRRVVRPLTATERLQEEIARALGHQRELVKMQEQIDRITGASATAKLQADIERALGHQRELERWKEQADQLTGRRAFLKFAKETEESAFMTIAERLRKQLGGGAVGGLGITQLLVPRIGSVVEQLQLGSALARADIVGRATDGLWLAEVKRHLEPLGAQHHLMEATLKALRPLSRQDDFQAYLQGIIEQLKDAGPEVEEEAQATGERIAEESLQETTPEGAYRKAVEFVRNLDPLQQMLLFLILLPFFQNLVNAVITPVSDHFIKGWLTQSPQGQQKQATERVVQEVGGTLLLENHRLVVRHKLAVRGVPAAASKVVATIEYGTAVRVIKENGAFTLVEWKTNDAVVSGWVFTRYLKKFK